MIKALIQPPGLQLLLLAVALICWQRFRHFSFALVALSLVSLYLLSTGMVANALMRGLESGIPVVTDTVKDQSHSKAIVILGTGVLENTPEYGGQPQPSALLAQRLHYGLKLAKDTRLPVLVSGGNPNGINEAQVMNRFLLEHGLAARWLEANSLTTADNARFSAQKLRLHGISTVLLVSHAWHLKRAQWHFRRAGLTVIAAPTAYASDRSTDAMDNWLPSARALRASQLALHEYMGLLWLILQQQG